MNNMEMPGSTDSIKLNLDIVTTIPDYKKLLSFIILIYIRHVRTIFR